MLNEINNDFVQIKELFMNDTKNNYLCNSNNNNINQSNVMSAGQDFIDNEILICNHNTNKINTYDFQKSADLEYIGEFEQYINTNQCNHRGCYHDNMEVCDIHEPTICTEQNLQQKITKGFYQIQSTNSKIEDTNNTIHHFSWTNLSDCQCEICLARGKIDGCLYCQHCDTHTPSTF